MKRLSLFYGFMIVLAGVSMLFFMDFSIMGIGLGGICFLLVAVPTLVSCGRSGLRTLPLTVTLVCLSVGFFISVATFSRMVAGGLGYLDIRHLISMLALPAWMVLGGLLAVRHPRMLEWIGSWVFTGISVLVVLITFTLLVSTGDVGFFRNDVPMTESFLKTCFSNPNVLARLCLVLLGVQLLLASDREGVARHGHFVLAAGIACVILLTGSRANVFAMLPILAVLAFVLGPRGRLVLCGTTILMMSLALASPYGQERFADLFELLQPSSEESLDMDRSRNRAFSVSLSIIRDHPLAGVGLAMENELMAARGSLSANSVSSTIVPHGTFLKLAVRYGLPAVLAFVVFIGVFAYALLRREPDEGYGMNAARSPYRWFGVAILLAVAISSLAADAFSPTGTELVFAWILAMKTVTPHTDGELS